MITVIYSFFSFILLLAVAAGMIRIIIGPTAADRMTAAQLFGTCGIAILLVFSKLSGNDALLDIALVFALLAVLSTMTFVRRAWFAIPEKGEPHDQS